MKIRAEQPADVASIRDLSRTVFETSTEADLVDALRERAQPYISLVADGGSAIVGHIMFSPAKLSSDPNLRIIGLAPMAVSPEQQRKGIGAALIRAGLEQCREMGYRAVVVLGHADYYPRFGFLPASRFGLVSEYDVPDENFMALELEPGALGGKGGTVSYHPAFAAI